MKKTLIFGFIMICASSAAMADGYDYADEMAYRQIANKCLIINQRVFCT